MHNHLKISELEMIKFEAKSILEIYTRFSDEQKCIDFLEELVWKGHPVSPFDKTSKVYKCKNNRYRCANTRKYFTVKTGTIFENTKISLRHWFAAIWMFTSHKSGFSSMELQREFGITQKSAWFMIQRIREAAKCENYGHLGGEVECDETYVGGKMKNKHKSKRIENAQGRSTKSKMCVFGMLERYTKRVSATVVPSASSENLMKHIGRTIEFDATVYTDEWLAYNQLDGIYEHLVVRHGERQYVDGDAHTNSIENFWGNFKRGIIGVYRVLSYKHLQRYVDEFVFRRNTCKYRTDERFLHLLQNVRGARLKYADLIKDVKEAA